MATDTRGPRKGEKQISLDPAPLFAWLQRRRPRLRPTELADQLGVSRQRVDQWKNGRARMNLFTADEICCRYGAHPGDVWGDAYWRAIGVDIPPLGWPKKRES